jgi:thymidylate synthase (FAD)
MAQMNVSLVRPPMGDDLAVVNAARVSFDKESEWVSSKFMPGYDGVVHQEDNGERVHLSEKDAKLIRYLAKHGHWSPFTHTGITLRVKAPIFVARQLQKHQVGFNWNEVSRRYVDSQPDFYEPEAWRKRADNVKQGSSTETVDDPWLGVGYRATLRDAHATYDILIGRGVCPEQARMVLPQSMMTEWVWTGNVYGFSRVCRQRLDPHSQVEVRVIAQQVADIIQPLFPVSWKELMA